MNNDDDDSSVGSVAFFQEEDFDRSAWGSVVTPTNALVVMAGVGLLAAWGPLTMLLLPISLGASQVASHAHELLVEEYELWKNHDANNDFML